MSTKKVIIAITFVVAIIGGLSTGGFMYVYSKTKDFDQIFMEGIYVEQTYIGGLTKEEARSQVSKEVQKKDEGKTILLYGDDKEWIIPYTKFQGAYNIDEVLDKAFQLGHEGNMIQRFKAFTSKSERITEFTLVHSYNKDKAEEIIKEYADELYIAPQDATMIRKDKKFIITPEKSGQELDIKATAEKVNAIYDSQENGKVEVAITPIPAKKTSSYFEKVQSPIASFYTSYNNADLNRNDNLKIGARTINTSIAPGETFSLSDYLEPISAKNGYKSSKVIVNGKLVDGIGGGICQVASTLYNSVLLTELEITSRQNHSLPVGYIPLGRDATYASNSIDFKFKNPTEHPVYVESYCENNRLYVNIFGHESLKPVNEIKFESVVVEVVPAPATKYEDDPTLPKGQEVQELAALDGKRVNLYKHIYKDGKLIDKILESKSYYRPRAAIVKVGTKEVADSTETSSPKDEEVIKDDINEVPEVIDDPSFMNLYEEQF